MIQDLRLQNFRSYKDAAFEFTEGVTIIVGPNASGKTNLLEAIQYICSGGSYRAKEAELVNFDSESARLEANADGQRRIALITNQPPARPAKEFSINKTHLKRIGLSRQIPIVLFEPEHLRLLHAGPEHRRDFLDTVLSKTTTGYSTLLRNYRRVLAQRNALLKSIQPSSQNQVFAWNVRLSELGGMVAQRRMQLIDVFNESMSDIYQSIAASTQAARLSYKSACSAQNYSTSLLHRLEAHMALDMERGFTGDGPHRDDFDVLLNNHNATDTASRGEIRTLLLTLKVLEMRLVETVFDQKPILLLDDVFSELDGTRRKALTEFLKDHQTFITTTDADVVVQHFIGSATIIPTTSL